MSCRILILLILIISTTIAGFGQSMEPMDLAKKIFSKEPFPNIEKWITGEYQGSPNGQDLQSGTVTHFLLLGQTSKKAVVAMTILDSTGKGFDSYLHFEKDYHMENACISGAGNDGYDSGRKRRT